MIIEEQERNIQTQLREITDLKTKLNNRLLEIEKRDIDLDRRELNVQKRENELRAKELDHRHESLMINESRNTPIVTAVQRDVSPYSSRSNLESVADIDLPRRNRVINEEKPEPRPIRTRSVQIAGSEPKLKEITETIPRFDGYNISVLQFSRACKRAMDLFLEHPSREIEAMLVRRIRAKLDGHAYSVTEDQELQTVEQLVGLLKAAFQPAKSASHYKGQLANIYMKPRERVLDYTERIKELKQAIIEAETKESGELGDHQRRRIECEVLDALENGLPEEYELRMKHERYHDLTTAANALLRISRALERNRARTGKEGPREISRIHAITSEKIICTSCKEIGHMAKDCRVKGRPPTFSEITARPPSPRSKNQVRNLTLNNRPPSPREQRTCYYCKRIGHILKDCRKLKYDSEHRTGDKRSKYNPDRQSPEDRTRNRRDSNEYKRKYNQNDDRRSPSPRDKNRERRHSTSSNQGNHVSGPSRSDRSGAAIGNAHGQTNAQATQSSRSPQ